MEFSEVTAPDGTTLSSNTDTVEELRTALDLPPAGAPVEPVADAVEAPAETPAPDAPASDRNPDGTFKAKAPEPEKKAKPRDDPQARIDQAIGRQREAERKAEALAKELESLRAPKPAEPKAPAPTTDIEPTPDQFDTYEKYVKAQARWEAREAVREADAHAKARWEADQAAAAQRTRAQTWQERLTKTRATMPDFDTRIAAHGDLMLTQPMVDAIHDSDLGPELLVYLAEHPDDVQRLSTLPPLQTMRAMGRLEATLDAAARGSVSVPKASNAKAPIKPLGSSPTSADPLEITDDLSVDEHIRRMNARDRALRAGR